MPPTREGAQASVDMKLSPVFADTYSPQPSERKPSQAPPKKAPVRATCNRHQAKSNVLDGPSSCELTSLLERQHKLLVDRLDALLKRHEELAQTLTERTSEHGPARIGGVAASPSASPSMSRDVSPNSQRFMSGQSLCSLDSGALRCYGSRYSDLVQEDREARAEAIRKAQQQAMDSLDSMQVRAQQAGGFESRGSISQIGAKLRTIVASTKFEIFIASLILTNSALMGVEVDFMASRQSATVPTAFSIVQHSYAFLFLIELMFRFGAEGRRFLVSPDWMWNYLDMFIVLSSFLEAGVDVVTWTKKTDDGDVGSVGDMGSLRIIRMVRLTRLIRVFRVARGMRFARALRTLVYSIFGTLKSLVWAMILLLMIIYVFGIIFTQCATEHLVAVQAAAHELELDEACSSPAMGAEGPLWCYWGSLSSSMFTLFKSICGGLSWDVAVRPLGEISIVWTMLFAAYIFFTYFAVLNVVTGVFCQSAMDSAARDHDMAVSHALTNKKTYVDKLCQLFDSLDGMDTGQITFDVFERHLTDEPMQAYFASMDLDVDDAWTLFRLLDVDNTRAVDADEFVVGCLKLKGPAKSIHIAQLIYENRRVMSTLVQFMNFAESRLASSER